MSCRTSEVFYLCPSNRAAFIVETSMQQGNVCFAPSPQESEAKTTSSSISPGSLGVDTAGAEGPYCTLSPSDYGLKAVPDALVQAMDQYDIVISDRNIGVDRRIDAMSKFGELYSCYLAAMDHSGNEYLGATHVLDYLKAEQELALSSLRDKHIITDQDLKKILDARETSMR